MAPTPKWQTVTPRIALVFAGAKQRTVRVPRV